MKKQVTIVASFTFIDYYMASLILIQRYSDDSIGLLVKSPHVTEGKQLALASGQSALENFIEIIKHQETMGPITIACAIVTLGIEIPVEKIYQLVGSEVLFNAVRDQQLALSQE